MSTGIATAVERLNRYLPLAARQADLPQGLANILAAQAMFPVTSLTEMAGQPPEM